MGLTVSPTTMHPGDQIVVHYGYAADKSGGVIALCPGGAPNIFKVEVGCGEPGAGGANKWGQCSPNGPTWYLNALGALASQPINGTQGVAMFTAPAPGNYVMQGIYHRDGGTIDSVPFSVAAPPNVNVPTSAVAPTPAAAPAPAQAAGAQAAAAAAAAQAAAQAAAAAAAANPTPATQAAAATAAAAAVAATAAAATATAAAAPAATGGGPISSNTILLAGGAALLFFLMRRR